MTVTVDTDIRTGEGATGGFRKFSCFKTYLFEFTSSQKSVHAVFRSSNPADVVISVELNTLVAVLFTDQLDTIIIHEHVGGSTLKLVGGDGLFDGFDRGGNDRVQTFLVDRALDSDMRKDSISKARRRLGGVVSGVGLHLSYRADNLRNATDDDLSEELGEDTASQRRRMS